MTLNLEKKLAKRKKRGNFRQLQIFQPLIAQPLIDFSSNDTLGLAGSSRLATLVQQECENQAGPLNGLGSTGSRLLTGNSAYAEMLEEKIAAIHGYEAGVLFNCGYMANVGLLSSFGDECTIFFDAGIHASTMDGIRLSRAKAFPFRHNDLDHLECRLKNCSIPGDKLICIESIYSTDGSRAPLREICQIAEKYQAKLIVDEAHAVGVYGPKGKGLVAHEDLMDQIFAQITTFGKALGTFGAIVLGGKCLKEFLINYSHAYIYTTALPLRNLAAIKTAYDIFPQMDVERAHIQKLIKLFQKVSTCSSTTHIQSIFVAGNVKVRKASEELANFGFDVRPLLSPTVRRGKESLRVCLHAFNTENELIQLLDHLK